MQRNDVKREDYEEIMKELMQHVKFDKGKLNIDNSKIIFIISKKLKDDIADFQSYYKSRETLNIIEKLVVMILGAIGDVQKIKINLHYKKYIEKLLVDIENTMQQIKDENDNINESDIEEREEFNGGIATVVNEFWDRLDAIVSNYKRDYGNVFINKLIQKFKKNKGY